jgi:hypothetical protein
MYAKNSLHPITISRLAAMLLCAALVCTTLFTTGAERAYAAVEPQAGDIVYFGTYPQSWSATQSAGDGRVYAGTAGYYDVDPIAWRVLANEGGELFLLADKLLDRQPYHVDHEDVTFERSTIRSWLNGYGADANNGDGLAISDSYNERPANVGVDYSASTANFYDVAFSADEQTAIAVTNVENPDNPQYGTDGGIDTVDKVFLLSYQEAIDPALGFLSDYGAYDPAREAKTTAYSGAKGVPNGWWWLRSPGISSNHAAFVQQTSGGIYRPGSYVNNAFGVRPALNLHLASSIFTSASPYDGKTTWAWSYSGTPAPIDGWSRPEKTYSAAIDPATAEFGTIEEGYTQQAEKTFTITNTGTGGLSNIAAVLDTGTAFEIQTAPPSSLAAGATATVSVRPKTGLAPGSYSDTLRITGSSGVALSASLRFTVTEKQLPAPAQVTKIRAPQTSFSVVKKKSFTIPVAFDLAEGETAQPVLTWTSNNAKVATVDPATGKITAKKTGTVKITVTTDSGKSKTFTVKVVAKAVKVKAVKVTKPPKTLAIGKTKTLKVSISPKTATGAAATFKSSKPAVLSVDKAGKLTAKKKGTAKITVKAGGKKATVTITVK